MFGGVKKMDRQEVLKRFQKVWESTDYKSLHLASAILADIIQVMHDKGITQAAVAEKLGISEAAVSQRFSRTANTELRTLVELADAVGCEIDYAIVEANNINWNQQEVNFKTTKKPIIKMINNKVDDDYELAA